MGHPPQGAIDASLQDSLLDLLGSEGGLKLVIKRDLNGSVKVEGAVAREARTAGELRNVFDAGLSRRSTASTLMNVEVSPCAVSPSLLLE